MTISRELLDELLSGVERPEDLLGDKGLMKELKVRLMERMLGAELTEHLGYEPHGEPASQQSNRRNGAARKVLKGNDGAVPIDIPRVIVVLIMRFRRRGCFLGGFSSVNYEISPCVREVVRCSTFLYFSGGRDRTLTWDTHRNADLRC